MDLAGRDVEQHGPEGFRGIILAMLTRIAGRCPGTSSLQREALAAWVVPQAHRHSELQLAADALQHAHRAVGLGLPGALPLPAGAFETFQLLLDSGPQPIPAGLAGLGGRSVRISQGGLTQHRQMGPNDSRPFRHSALARHGRPPGITGVRGDPQYVPWRTVLPSSLSHVLKNLPL
jgi:hypothetical protein